MIQSCIHIKFNKQVGKKVAAKNTTLVAPDDMKQMKVLQISQSSQLIRHMTN